MGPKEAVAMVRQKDREHREAMDALQTCSAGGPEYEGLRHAENEAWKAKQAARENLSSVIIDTFGVHVFDLKRFTET